MPFFIDLLIAQNFYKNTNIKCLYLKYIIYQILLKKIKNVISKKSGFIFFFIDIKKIFKFYSKYYLQMQ